MSNDEDEYADDALTPAQLELAGALRGLRPAAPGPANRERLVFKAGVAVGRRSVNRWRGLAAALVVVNAAWIAVALRPGAAGPNVSGYVVVQPPTPATAPSHVDGVRWSPEPRSTSSPVVNTVGYFAMRDAVLRDGLAGLPQPRDVRPSRKTESLNVEDLLEGSPSPSSQQQRHSGERL